MRWTDWFAEASPAWPEVGIHIGIPEILPAVLAGLATYLLLHSGLRLVVRQLRRLSRRSRTGFDDTLVQALASTRPAVLAGAGVLVALNALPLSAPWPDRLAQVGFAAIAIQLGLWAQQVLTGLLWAHEVKLASPASAAATAPGDAPLLSAYATLMGWGLRGALWAVILLAVLSNLGVDITAFVASLGIGGIAIALAVQNILGDLFASLAIAVDKPFEVGDSITVGDVTGTVERVGLKTTRIRSLGGEQVVMSNAELLKRTVANFKRLQTRRVQFNFGIRCDTSADDVAAVPPLLRELIEADPQLQFARAHFTGFGDNAYNFEVVYRVLDPSYDVHMDRRQALNLALLRALQARRIQLAFAPCNLQLVGVGVGVGMPAPAAR